MALVNTTKPTTTLANTAKVSGAETWGTIPTTWATETRTWEECVSLMDNTSLGTTGVLWSVRRFPWTEATPWLTEGGIINTAKPI
jgi:hypothetical protein